ncbi:MAG TPA: bifunctional methylenetetrahydrofolate dehydrogenase/methenyltetrahydrofolate cyclohydrolase FolD [Kiritimatiellia bacterium]|nr:bifunctional methylenetetrahydrofolate dehydrogenase/methenyltetrahydrofolate cyclohydrolase FolD [Kiritimatiellia bacterium]HPJ57495.1 bifunctional methylenetetrahydrofolate dehydrogenase/methenyltetrahydrofolate cyclohydrolase FolD [Kiritimatiellia bacterium]HPR68897.1 bifunctional methylenetetrahydrofolate dehydrogenase/methenyltetrahydrofolate cyclohydrolase FolD [Kiritimatiellia bacterium]HRX06351.1 bifunctional methylenetetrahydrofolate dehydrogenase/methenyltetrahydrofolate cyclohydrol
MSARILDGKSLAAELRAEIAAEVAALHTGSGRAPGLAVVLAGEDPASRSYVTAKEKACAAAGIRSREITLPASAGRADILSAVRALNEDDEVDGILVQLPLPDPSIEREVIEAVDPAKDVDGFHPVNIGRMVLGLPAFVPCTPAGVIEILRRAEIPLSGAAVTVIGRSQIVGRPLSVLLSQKGVDATVTLCHTRTKDLARHTRGADVVVVAAGRPGTLTADMIRPGAVVVDVGVNRVPDASRASGYRLAGDADFDGLREVAGAITPVPGGVGPMTIAMLLRNTVEAARRRRTAPA